MQRREFLTSLFGGAVAAPFGARGKLQETDAAGRESNADLQFNTALHAFAVEHERLLAEIKRRDEELASANEHIVHMSRLVHEINCLTAVILLAAGFIQCGNSAEFRAEFELIADTGQRIAKLIREAFERDRSRRRLAASV